MKLSRLVAVLLAAGTSVTIAATAALAQVATSTVELNVRSGPGTSYPVTYVLQPGARVEIIRRSGNWAFVVGERGGEGWVFASYLSEGGGQSGGGNQGGGDYTTNYESTGSITNARYTGSGTGGVLVQRQGGRNAAMVNILAGGFNITYMGTPTSNFEGAIEIRVDRVQSSEIAYRTVPVTGTCNAQVSGQSVRTIFCDVRGDIDHGRTTFSGR